MALLPENTSIAILASHKIGHVVPCRGIARALGIEPQMRPVRPRSFFKLLAPWGPPDPRASQPGGELSAPWPDIALASSRETVPYLRAIKKASGGRTFTIYLGDPRASRGEFDLIVLPEHDTARGANILTTLTSPHPHDETARAAAHANPDHRVAALPGEKVALFIGGPSGAYAFEPSDVEAIASIASAVLASGRSLMVSPSRRTPHAVMDALRTAIAASGADAHARCFIWDGSGANPYVTMLALASAFVVTADSVNMTGETIATGRPVHVYEPTGNAGKFAHFMNELLRRGVIRPWSGRVENWTYEPVDSTPLIAEEVARRYEEFVARRK